MSPWKTQCAQSILAAVCPSMECQSIDLMWLMCCAGLGAHSGQCGAGPLSSRPRPPFGVGLWSGGSWLRYLSATMGLLGVKDITAPEVKFLDRCKINCSEGALQVHVRRSRMRVWGAKMIRHRRSPQL
jgi:hypothetical protein